MARCRAGRRCDCRRPEVGGEAGAGDDGPTRLHQHQGQRESGVDRERHHLRQHRLVVAAIDLFKDITATDWIGCLKMPLRLYTWGAIICCLVRRKRLYVDTDVSISYARSGCHRRLTSYAMIVDVLSTSHAVTCHRC